MAKKLCDLCQKEFADDMRFGVNLCRYCSDGYDRAMLGDEACKKRFSDLDNFPNATVEARRNVIGIVARKAQKEEQFHKQMEKQTIPVKIQALTNSAKEEPRKQKKGELPDAMDGLYSNIGNKIKGWAKWIFLVEAVCLGCSALVWLFCIENVWEVFIIPLAVAAGLAVAWVSTWLLYAFGELVEKTVANEENTRNILELLRQKEK